MWSEWIRANELKYACIMSLYHKKMSFFSSSSFFLFYDICTTPVRVCTEFYSCIIKRGHCLATKANYLLNFAHHKRRAIHKFSSFNTQETVRLSSRSLIGFFRQFSSKLLWFYLSYEIFPLPQWKIICVIT